MFLIWSKKWALVSWYHCQNTKRFFLDYCVLIWFSQFYLLAIAFLYLWPHRYNIISFKFLNMQLTTECFRDIEFIQLVSSEANELGKGVITPNHILQALEVSVTLTCPLPTEFSLIHVCIVYSHFSHLHVDMLLKHKIDKSLKIGGLLKKHDYVSLLHICHQSFLATITSIRCACYINVLFR